MFFASKNFWIATLERAVKTMAQALIAFLGANVTGVLEVDWVQAASVAGMAAVVSVLTSIASTGVGDPGTPSLVREPRHVKRDADVD